MHLTRGSSSKQAVAIQHVVIPTLVGAPPASPTPVHLPYKKRQLLQSPEMRVPHGRAP